MNALLDDDQTGRATGPAMSGREILLAEILDAQLELVCRFLSDGTILYVNQAYANSIGASTTDLSGSNLWKHVTPEDRAHVETGLEGLTVETPVVTIENRFETIDGPRWLLWRNHALSFDANGKWLEAQSTGFDITERKALEERQILLVEELNHRVRNTLAVVQALAHQSFRTSDLDEGSLEIFEARLRALSAAHSALSRTNWEGTAIHDIVRDGLLLGEGVRRNILFSGPTANISARCTVPLVMALHELTTNAIKHGGLSTETGHVRLDWTHGKNGNSLEFEWTETGGPTVSPPRQPGFGTKLITTTITRQLFGTIALDYRPEGLSCRFTIPLG